MAYNDLFVGIDNALGVSPMGVMKTTVAGAGDPVIIHAVGTIQVSITVFDVHCVCTATVGCGTFQIETDLAAIGYAAFSDVMVMAVVEVPARATTLVAAQGVLGPADAVRVDKNGATNAGIVYLMFYLT